MFLLRLRSTAVAISTSESAYDCTDLIQAWQFMYFIRCRRSSCLFTLFKRNFSLDIDGKLYQSSFFSFGASQMSCILSSWFIWKAIKHASSVGFQSVSYYFLWRKQYLNSMCVLPLKQVVLCCVSIYKYCLVLHKNSHILIHMKS